MSHPVVIVGAGPVGLAAAAHARRRGLEVVVLERGEAAGAAVTEWGHVRLFSSWSELVDPVRPALLARAGWWAPDPTAYPTGAQWVQEYLAPLAEALPREGAVRYGTGWGVARRGRDLLVDAGRDHRAVRRPRRGRRRAPGGRASAVVDASGTWLGPNPLGADGYRLPGERAHAGADHATASRTCRPGRRRAVRRQARRRRRHRRLGAERPGRAGPARGAGAGDQGELARPAAAR